eukprot:366296-Chlamydomonas_euryale.AAC.14
MPIRGMGGAWPPRVTMPECCAHMQAVCLPGCPWPDDSPAWPEALPGALVLELATSAPVPAPPLLLFVLRRAGSFGIAFDGTAPLPSVASDLAFSLAGRSGSFGDRPAGAEAEAANPASSDGADDDGSIAPEKLAPQRRLHGSPARSSPGGAGGADVRSGRRW